jgi:hypothetical protein
VPVHRVYRRITPFPVWPGVENPVCRACGQPSWRTESGNKSFEGLRPGRAAPFPHSYFLPRLTERHFAMPAQLMNAAQPHRKETKNPWLRI